MATIKFKKLGDTVKAHQTALAKQIAAGNKKLLKAKKKKDVKEIQRISEELECRAKAKAAIDAMVVLFAIPCCDQFQDCPEI
jgi:predicted dinucleotide-binding enzyme